MTPGNSLSVCHSIFHSIWNVRTKMHHFRSKFIFERLIHLYLSKSIWWISSRSCLFSTLLSLPWFATWTRFRWILLNYSFKAKHSCRQWNTVYTQSYVTMDTIWYFHCVSWINKEIIVRMALNSQFNSTVLSQLGGFSYANIDDRRELFTTTVAAVAAQRLLLSVA